MPLFLHHYFPIRYVVSSEQFVDVNSLFAAELETQNVDISVTDSDFLIGFAVGLEAAYDAVGSGLKCHTEDLDVLGLAFVVEQLHGGGRIGRKPTDKVDYAGAGQLPVDGTVGFKDFGSGTQAVGGGLRTGCEGAVGKALDGTHH